MLSNGTRVHHLLNLSVLTWAEIGAEICFCETIRVPVTHLHSSQTYQQFNTPSATYISIRWEILHSREFDDRSCAKKPDLKEQLINWMIRVKYAPNHVRCEDATYAGGSCDERLSFCFALWIQYFNVLGVTPELPNSNNHDTINQRSLSDRNSSQITISGYILWVRRWLFDPDRVCYILRVSAVKCTCMHRWAAEGSIPMSWQAATMFSLRWPTMVHPAWSA